MKRVSSQHVVRGTGTQEALRAGLPFASVWDGALGYGEGAQAIAARLPEHGPMDNPACVELLGSREALDRFAHDHEGELEDAIVVIYDGTRFICEGKTSDPRSEHVQNK